MALPTVQFNADDDNFDQIPVGVTHEPTTAAAQAAAQPATAPAAAVTDDDVSFDDENINEAVKAADGLTMIKINKGEVARFAFVPGLKIKRARVHYIEGTGSVQCISTKEKQEVCCKKAEQAKDRFVALVFRYTNVDPKTGKFLANATGPVVEVQAVRMSRSNMRDILDSVEDGQSVYDVDIRMKHDESRAFGYKFSKASSTNAWRKEGGLGETETLALAKPLAEKLASRLGKKLDSIQLNALLAGTGAGKESQANMEKLLSAMEDSD